MIILVWASLTTQLNEKKIIQQRTTTLCQLY